MKTRILNIVAVSLVALSGCANKKDDPKTITIACSESPHSIILNQAVKPILEKEGYKLEVTVLDWTIQNDGVNKGDYDANYFQHRPYLEQYDSGSADYDPDYTYTKVFPVCEVHFEPLRIYEGKAKAGDFEKNKKSATYEICSDVSNQIRALDLLKACGAIDGYEKDKDGNPILPKSISLIDEAQLVVHREDYDYAVLPCNTALTGNLVANDSLPVEGDEVADLRANVVAANVKKYKENAVYKTKIDALCDAVLSKSVASFIKKEWNGVITSQQVDLRK